ncbi:MAG: nitroreductase [Candidatus Parcubacteria bacterium]|nr:MAG: nitroreductase [Candidatus Parcubacteria bacterium]
MKILDLTNIFPEKKDIWEKFHKSTNNKKQNFTKEIRRKTDYKVYYKAYERFPEIKLPKPSLNSKKEFKEILESRKSNRDFKQKKISLSKISNLLYYSVGLKNLGITANHKRFYPSAGALYPIETYIISLKTALAKKPYLLHYYPRSHSLEELWSLKKKEIRNCFSENFIIKSSLIIILTAVFQRTTRKYGNRGYRYIQLEAGHIGQNFYLLSVTLGLNCCAIGGFIEDKLNKVIDIDGFSESAIYCLAIG